MHVDEFVRLCAVMDVSLAHFFCADPDKVTVPELGWRWHEQRKLLKNLSPLTHKTDERELKKVGRWFTGVLVRDGRATWVEGRLRADIAMTKRRFLPDVRGHRALDWQAT